MAFLRRLSWPQLQKAGLKLVPEEFVVARRPLTYGFSEVAVGQSVHSVLPVHRLRQFYAMRRIDAKINPAPVKGQPYQRIPAASTASPAAIPPTVSSAPLPFLPPAIPVPVAVESESGEAVGGEAETSTGYKPRMRGRKNK